MHNLSLIDHINFVDCGCCCCINAVLVKAFSCAECCLSKIASIDQNIAVLFVLYAAVLDRTVLVNDEVVNTVYSSDLVLVVISCK